LADGTIHVFQHQGSVIFLSCSSCVTFGNIC